MNSKNISYYYGKSKGVDVVHLRGSGTKAQDVQSVLKAHGFKWVFNKGRKKICAWESECSINDSLALLLELREMGYMISPSSSLNPKRRIYLDKPKIRIAIKVGKNHQITLGELVDWLTNEGYSKVDTLGDVGEFKQVGDSVYVWTIQDDSLMRVCFDNEAVDTVSVVDPDTMKAQYEDFIEIEGLVERENDLPKEYKKPNVERIFIPRQIKLPKKKIGPLGQAKYASTSKDRMLKSFKKLDESHPFFNMIKWD